MGDTATVIGALLGAGGIAFLSTLFNGLQSLRRGARARERDTFDVIIRTRDEAVKLNTVLTRDCRFWQTVCGRYAYQLRLAGLTPDPESPTPPSEREVS